MTQVAGRRRQPAVLGLTVVLVLATVVGVLVGRYVVPDRDNGATAPSAVDVGFSQDMIAHHQQAVQMARIVLDRVDDPASADIVMLARQIIDTQMREIGVMSGYLQLWERSQMASGASGSWMPHDGVTTMPSMPGMDHAVDVGHDMGMATQEQLAELSTLGGSALTERFTQLMTRHHLGAIAMADVAATAATTPAVRRLAAGIVIEQQKEIQYLTTVAARSGP